MIRRCVRTKIANPGLVASEAWPEPSVIIAVLSALLIGTMTILHPHRSNLFTRPGLLEGVLTLSIRNPQTFGAEQFPLNPLTDPSNVPEH